MKPEGHNRTRKICALALLPLLGFTATGVAAQTGWQDLVQDPFELTPKDQSVSQLREINIAVPGEYMLDASSETGLEQARSFLSQELGAGGYQLDAVPNSTLGVVKFPVPKGGWINFNDYLALLEKAPGIKQAQPNFVRYTSNSPLQDPQVRRQWFLSAINVESAWQVNQDASSITVAVIDDAIMVQHEDLEANLWRNANEIPGNGVDDDRNGYVDDIVGWNFGNKTNDPSPTTAGCIESGHGTHVAGAIGAVGGNGKGVTGVSPKVKVMALAVGRADSQCGLDSSGILQAVRYAVDNGARVINLSLGGPVGTNIARATYQYANDRNVLIVVAAGNDGLSNDIEDVPRGSQMTLAALVRNDKIVHRAMAPSYPAAFSRAIPGMITVANLQSSNSNAAGLALYQHDLSWDYVGEGVQIRGGKLVVSGLKKLQPGTLVLGSSYGAHTVQIGTPGTDIFSTVPTASGNRAASGYAMMTGTSMASPITAGAAALVWSSFPDMTNVQVKERLLASVKKNTSLNGKVGSLGQLDVYEALCGDQFSRKAEGCGGNASSKPAPPDTKPTPPPVAKKPEPPQAQPKPAPEPEPAPQPKPKPKPKQTPNDWLRGAEDDSSSGGIEW